MGAAMIDWRVKIKNLKRMADELDQWSRKSKGRQRLVLGRISDELLMFAHEVARVLEEDGIPRDVVPEPLPEWLYDLPEGIDLSDDDDAYGNGWEATPDWLDEGAEGYTDSE